MQPNPVDFPIVQRVVAVVLCTVVNYRHHPPLARNVPGNGNGNGKTLLRLTPKNVVVQNSLVVGCL